MAPTGVDALNSIRCFLHSTRERDVDIRETVYARAVGAARPTTQLSGRLKGKARRFPTVRVSRTLVYRESQENHHRQSVGMQRRLIG